MKYDIKVSTLDGLITSEVKLIGADAGLGGDDVCQMVTRGVIDTREELVRKALIELGWTPPQKTLRSCIVRGCVNTSGQGHFAGDLCMACRQMLEAGIAVYGDTFVHKLQADSNQLQQVKSLFRDLTKENQT